MISFDDVTKSFGAKRAVDSLSFEAPAGRITAFLGPNGAGKSTSLRMLCSLCRPNSGRATIGGRTFDQLVVPGRTVGVLLDATAQHPGRTGREVLSLAAMCTHQPAAKGQEMLEMVGLADSATKKVGAYSLGMRQRLGVAVALVGDPQVLILDEPANGLDPEGVRWLRGLMDDFATAGGTVLLSSHILAEVQQIADRIVMLDHGRKVAEAETRELLAVRTGVATIVDAEELARLVEQLALAGIEVSQRSEPGVTASASPESIGALAARHGIALTRLEPARRDLEDVFFSLTHSD
jgi:ABC-2 type transport system ATP-binding protein